MKSYMDACWDLRHEAEQYARALDDYVRGGVDRVELHKHSLHKAAICFTDSYRGLPKELRAKVLPDE